MIQKIVIKNFLFLLLIPIVIFSQLYILAPHLKFGLIDLDNGTLYDFRQLREKYPDNIPFLMESYKLWGAYSREYYYLGILNFFFGSNFENYHQTTHILKMIATVTAYPLFYIISGSSFVAFIASIIFAFSSSSVGSLESVIHGGTYAAIAMFNIFLSLYIYSIKNKTSKFSIVFMSFIFLLLSLIFSTDKLFPALMLILIFEFICIVNNHSKVNLKLSINRIGILLFPLLIFLIFKPTENEIGGFGKLWVHFVSLIQSLFMGRLDHLLIPFSALSTTTLPVTLWNFIGMTQSNNFIEYFGNLLTIPTIKLMVPTLCIAVILYKRILRFCLIVFLTTFIGGLFIYIFSLGHSGIGINQAIAGFYILGLAFGFLAEWFDNKNNIFLGLFLAPLLAFLFILDMWAASGELDLFFGGVHRYVTVASIFTSLFLGNLIVALSSSILQKSRKQLLSFIPLLILIPVIYLSMQEISNWYNYSFAIGFAQKDKDYMREQLNPYFQNLSLENPRLIYIDVYTDQINNQYYGNTVVAGFNVWPQWLPNINFKGDLIPYLTVDFNLLKSSVTEINGQKGILYYQTLNKRNVFYRPENFYAVLLKDKKAVDITDQVKKQLGLY